jgi:hypothetical protein
MAVKSRLPGQFPAQGFQLGANQRSDRHSDELFEAVLEVALQELL